MFTTVALAIGGFATDLTLTGDNWLPGDPRVRINVLGDGRPDPADHDWAAYFQCCADSTLAARGYRRTDEWEYSSRRDAYVATITPSGKEGD